MTHQRQLRPSISAPSIEGASQSSNELELRFEMSGEVYGLGRSWNGWGMTDM